MKVGEGEGGSSVNKKAVVDEDNSHPLFQGDAVLQEKVDHNEISTITKIPVGQIGTDHDGNRSLSDTPDLTTMPTTLADVQKAPEVVTTSSKEQDSNPEKSDSVLTVPPVGGSVDAITKRAAHVDLPAPTNGTHLVPSRIGSSGQDKSQNVSREENGSRNSLVKLVVKSFKRVGKDKRRQDGSLVEVSVLDLKREGLFATLLETYFVQELTPSFVLQGSYTDTVKPDGEKAAQEGTYDLDKIALDSDLGETLGRTHEILVSLASSSEVEMSELSKPHMGLKIDHSLDHSLDYYRKMRSAPSSGSETIQTNNTTDGREWAEVILTTYVASNPCYCFAAEMTPKLLPQSNANSDDLPCSSTDGLVATNQALEAGSCVSEEAATTALGPVSRREQKVS
jgi:hypothetical protein